MIYTTYSQRTTSVHSSLSFSPSPSSPILTVVTRMADTKIVEMVGARALLIMVMQIVNVFTVTVMIMVAVPLLVMDCSVML